LKLLSPKSKHSIRTETAKSPPTNCLDPAWPADVAAPVDVADSAAVEVDRAAQAVVLVDPVDVADSADPVAALADLTPVDLALADAEDPVDAVDSAAAVVVAAADDPETAAIQLVALDHDDLPVMTTTPRKSPAGRFNLDSPLSHRL